MVPVSAEGLQRHAGALLDFLFPPACVSCGKRGSWICPKCFAQFTPLGPVCPVCARPQGSAAICPSCLGKFSPLDGISAAYRFEGPLRLAIHRFKYQNARILARPLAEAMAVRLKAPDTLTLLVPVPLHYKRLRERGYNQSELLSVELAGRFKLEVDHAALERVLNTFPQARIPDAGERHRNLAGAFAVRSSQIKGRSVIIVDDVCTTGATLESCAAALRQSGAVSVHAWTLAREV